MVEVEALLVAVWLACGACVLMLADGHALSAVRKCYRSLVARHRWFGRRKEYPDLVGAFESFTDRVRNTYISGHARLSVFPIYLSGVD